MLKTMVMSIFNNKIKQKFKVTRRAYFLCSIRVIRGQSGASQKAKKLRQFWLILGLKTLSGRNLTVRLSWDIFLTLENVILIWIAGPKPQIYEINTLKSWDLDVILTEKNVRNDEQMVDPSFVQDHSGKVPEGKGDLNTWF